jgi:hypothetical protein
MKNKSFLNKFEELKPKVPIHLDVEKKLVPRLKFMGYVMYVLSLIAFAFAFTIKEEGEIIQPLQEGFTEPEEIEALTGIYLMSDDDELELGPTEVLNFYLVSSIFAVVGTSCFLIVWKKKKTLFHETQVKNENSGI